MKPIDDATDPIRGALAARGRLARRSVARSRYAGFGRAGSDSDAGIDALPAPGVERTNRLPARRALAHTASIRVAPSPLRAA